MPHGKKVYDKLNDIPSGHAKGQLTKGCLVVEGGAFRGLYNQGVMDFFMENGLNFECVIGVSAGAMAGLNYASGQIGRSARCNLEFRHDPDYIGAQAVLHAHSPLNIDFAIRPNDKLDSLDENTFYDPRRRFIAVATDCDTGKTMYFEKGKCKDILKAIKASASMPYVSPMVDVDGHKCLDGGCSCHIPYQWAMDQGYQNIVVIKTRERGYRKKESSTSNTMAPKFYKDNPEFVKKLTTMNVDYNKECDEIDRLEQEGRIFVIAPSEHVTVKRVESDMDKLGNLYWLGYNDAKKNLFALKKYLR
jgi:predicted patatin/cPLA2 family phospholipase